jgi:hypothetical protein
VKRYEQYGGKKSLIVKRFGKYGGMVSWIVKNMENIEERQVDKWNGMEET